MDINKIKNELIKQKESKFKGNIYHYSQVNFAYNSNKIEGNRLTSEQTEAIFDTLSFIPKSDDAIKLDDLIEMKNQYLGMLENGQRGLTIEKAIYICNKTGVTCDYLLRGTESSIKEVARKMLSKYSNENIYTAFEILKDFALLLK